MTIQHYQDRAMSTCMDTCMNPVYMMMNLGAEVGELQGKIAKAAIDNSDSNLIRAYDREINRLEELERTLDNEFLNQPNKEYLASDLCKFLEDYPQVKANIKHYIRNNLECLSMSLYNRGLIQRYRKMVIELEQQLKEKEK